MNPPTSAAVAVLTPAGRGAVATVVIQGADALSYVERLFQPASGAVARCLPLRQIAYGRWRGGQGAGEDVVVCRTEVDRCEVHCHGGLAACQAIVDSLVSSGAHRMSWQDWIARNHVTSIESEALMALTATPTQATAAILLDQYRGSLRAAIDQVVAALRRDELQTAATGLRGLHGWSKLGLHLVHPWNVVLAGPPNVGKSSLVNALLGYQRAIVYQQPGTTRDVVTAQAALAGWPVQLSDTAGLRTVSNSVESAGVELARQQIAQADLVLLVFDASMPWTATEARFVDAVGQACVVHNKCDLIEHSLSDRPEGLQTSALTGMGVDTLANRIARMLVPQQPEAKAAVPFTKSQVDAICRSLDAITRGDPKSAIRLLEGVTRLPGFSGPRQQSHC